MKELSYHDSLKRKYSLLHPAAEQQLINSCGIYTGYLLKYYLPALTPLIQRLSPPKAAPLSNDYVLLASQATHPAQFTLLSKLQSHAKSNPSPPMPPLAIPAETMDHLAAGIDTTGDALCFLMHFLSLPTPESQAIQAALHRELSHSLSGPSKTTPFTDLPYLDAVIKEGLRMFPPIPMSFPRYVPPGGREIDGVWVPEHTIVSCQPWTLHKDERIFPRPMDFVPERWMPVDGEGEAVAAERNRAFFAFSAGGRGCLGRQ